ILKGTGKKVKTAELDFYKKLEQFVVVFWQQKAWIDSSVELMVIEKLVLPYRRRMEELYAGEGKTFPGLLLLEGRGPGHDDPFASLSIRANDSSGMSWPLRARRMST